MRARASVYVYLYNLRFAEILRERSRSCTVYVHGMRQLCDALEDR